MIDQSDENNAYKILELYEKLIDDRFIVSFTGHFSAGKSSMINELLGKDILPKSPIPTSGNIVEITSGGGFARVFFKDDTSLLYEEPYDIDTIKDFSKDNETVKKIELSMSEHILPKGSVIVDTPGIDAADDADRIMTESSLHLVDCLFYVMDYNHVQSEVNLYFLKEIQDRGIPFFIIINQVDKHDEKEITFQSFTNSVEQTFKQWGVYPEALFYCTLIDEENKHNQFTQIKKHLFSLFSSGKLKKNTIDQSVQQIITDHKAYLEDIYEEKLAKISDINVDKDNLFNQDDLKEKLTEMKQLPKQFEKEFQNDLDQTLKNAYLMPASLRETATLFLESQQKDFKVGVLGSKKKTLQEKKIRSDNFLQPLLKNIEATIQWNFRDKVISLLKKYNLTHPHFIQMTEQLAITYSAEELITLIKPGAKINGSYVLNYTNDVSVHIKNKYKNQTRDLLIIILKEMVNQTKDSVKIYEQQLAYSENIAEQKKQQQALRQEFADKRTAVDHQMEEPAANPVFKELMDQKIQEKLKMIEKSAQPLSKQEKIAKNEIVIEEQKFQNGNQSIEQITQAIDQTVATIEGLPGFQSMIDELKMKKDNLNNRTLTVALFGAFSAGKSSFANALIGEELLPSSPNPTTAVISRIAPITDKYDHGTVVIQLKDEQSLINDIVDLTRDFSPLNSDLADLINWMKENKIHENSSLDQVHQTYLQAVILGYPTESEQLGQAFTIKIEDFAHYVTDERKACFIELVTLYYDCSLTRLGITLVDTPGADSVNARHTSVAFDYIKYADAILYVTYYNHALSRADKDFLIQLGRVKEAFQLDKMFFIINAADLAESQSDLMLVVNYVEEQLLQLGIRFPKVFPVSSKVSLENKLNQQQLNGQMQGFETEFYRFINKDLVAISIQSAAWDIERVYQFLTNYMQTIHLNEKEKEQFRNDQLQIKQRLNQTIAETNAKIYEERINQRIERQLHYVKERVAIRFHDLFTDTFNPITISSSGRNAHVQLQHGLKILIKDVGYELLQESRAVSLRVESFIKNILEEVYKDLQDRSQVIDDQFLLPILEIESLRTPKYDQAFEKLELQQFSKALNLFKGTKAFFEKGKKDLMKEAIYNILVPHISHYIIKNQQIMDHSYLIQWEELFDLHKQQIKQHVEQYITNNLLMITDIVDIEVLKEKQQILASVIDMSKKDD
jgi:predicted GTPase